MDDFQRAQMRELCQRLTPILDRWLDCGPPVELAPDLLAKDWTKELPYLDWNEKGVLAFNVSNEGTWCVPIKPDAELPGEVKQHVEYATVISCGIRQDRPMLPVGSPPLTDYERVNRYHEHRRIYEGKKAWDEVFDAIADPDNPEPIPRSFLRKRPELAAWLNGELPNYAPTLTEYKVLWPAFIERRRRLRERGLTASGEPRPMLGDADAIQQQIAAGLQAAIAGSQLRDVKPVMDEATHSAHRPGEAIDAEPEAKLPAQTAHSPDFRSVNWFGQAYSFTANQAPVVRLLYENWQAGTPDVGDETLLAAVDPEAPPARLATLFRNHPAWGTMIIAGGSKGTRRLAKPAKGKS